LVGHLAIYNGEPSPCIYPDLMMKLSINLTKASTKFVWWWMQTERARGFILGNAKGSSPTMKKISQSVVMNVPFPSSMSVREQELIVEKLDELQAKVVALMQPQAGTGADLNALVPSILHKAFRGEL
jgi:type I restriction enzyme, S subunit